MKKILLTLAIATLALPVLALPKLYAMQSLGAGLLPEAPRDALRELARKLARHALNFRDETPLTKEQKQKLAEVMKTHRSEIKAVMERGRDSRRAYEQVVKSHGPESSQTREAAEKIGAVARDRALLMGRILSQAKPLLTAEQQQRVDTARLEIESLLDSALSSIR